MPPPAHWHVFSLPPELIQTLVPRTLARQAPPPPQEPEPAPPEPAPTSALSCAVCLGTTFRDVDEQRTHVRSDWHRYNVKARLAGGKPVDEPAFALLVSALDDSLSGSASSEDDEDESGQDSDTVSALVNKTKKLLDKTADDDDGDASRASGGGPVTAQTWFHSPPSTQIGVYRALFSVHSGHLDELKEMQQGRERKWALFMVAGGHFAGAVVRVSRSDAEEEGGKKKKPKQDTEVLRHKTFHRYTTRRKQGGSQSVNDNAKGAAVSAGAMLRRYGEQALRDDIRNLLADWAEDIDECERIWIRASVSNRRIFLDYEEAVFQKGDERLRTFPFPTRRPTQSEVQRCLLELTRVKVTHFTEAELRVQDEAYLASLPRPKPPPAPKPEPEKAKPKVPKLTKEEEAFREKWTRLLDMVAKGRLEVLRTFWEREGEALGGVNAAIPEWTGDRRTSLLQVAAQSGHEDVTQWMLEDLRADPTILMGGEGARRTAYELAGTKDVRDVFRRCAGAHGDWWDWFGAGRVPSALNREMEDERDEKRKARRKGLKDKIRERERAVAVEEEPAPVPVPEPPVKPAENPFVQRLGGTSGSTDGTAGLSAEMRARVERERRARAAEARLLLR